MKSSKYIIPSIIFFYAILHLAKLEFYPFYTFGMYSEAYGPTDQFEIIEIIIDGQVIDYKSLNYRKYTYLNNTLKAYTKIIDSGIDLAPQANIIKKHLELLAFNRDYNLLLRPYQYEDLESKMKAWLYSIYPSAQSIKLNRKLYELKGIETQLINEQIILQ